MKKVLIPGGTGAMGVYLVPELLRMGYAVDVVALDVGEIVHKNLTYTKANAKDVAVMTEILKKDYDAVVDFMIYPTKEEYERFLPLYLANTGHYIYLSTYRVYADEEHPIKETSPRILDVTKDETVLTSGDYCIYKAQGEDFLKALGKSHYTAIRPAVTYSKRRFQLVTLEMDVVMRRMLEGKKILLPEAAMPKQATMSWAGDVAKMIARLVCNKDAYGETYSVCTAEHMPWEEVARIYGRIGGLKYETTDIDTYLDVICGGSPWGRRQLELDRLYDRVMDNTKILTVTGMKQSELMPLAEGLRLEYEAFPKDFAFHDTAPYLQMEAYFNKKENVR